MARILLSGASGFLGRALTTHLRNLGHEVVPLSRNETVSTRDGHVSLSQLEAGTADHFDTIVHLAALAHVSENAYPTSQIDYQTSNVDLTRRLVDIARTYKIQRFIFMSSIGAVAANSETQKINDDTPPRPANAYGRSKLESEALVAALEQDNILAVSLRPPLVIGQGAPGNWGALVRLSSTGIPLPFKGINNKRSFISLQSVCEIVSILIRHPAEDVAASGAYAVTDPETLSTAAIVTELREGLGMRPVLIRTPKGFLRFIAAIIGRQKHIDSLTGSLIIDAKRFQNTFGWQPTISLKQAIRQSAVPSVSPTKRTFRLKRVFDFTFALFGLLAFALPLCVFMLAIRIESRGPAIFRQTRVGRYGVHFTCYKLRSMYVDVPVVPSHEILAGSVTRIGRGLRTTKIDELPQLWNIVRGEMSFVGPRPCLPTQTELIEARRENGVITLLPGITGAAQVKGIDMREPKLLASIDYSYMKSISIKNDLCLIIKTIF